MQSQHTCFRERMFDYIHINASIYRWSCLMGHETCQMNKCSYKDEIYIIRGFFFGGGVGEGWRLDIERISERKCEMMETWINNLEVLTVAQNTITYMSATVVTMTTSLIIRRAT